MKARTAAIVSMFAMSCDPVMGVRGEVRSVPRPEVGRGVVYDSGRPISDAEVFLVCSTTRRIATSGEDGTFSFVTAGWLPTQCSVEVRAAGYYTESVSLKDLCVHHDLGECHWANVSAELVPIAPRAGRAAEVAARPVHRIEFTATTPRLEVFDRGDQKFDLVEYVPLGATPVATGVTDGKHRVAAKFGKGPPVEALDDIVVSGPTRVDLEYADRSSLRTWKWVSFYSALVVGPVLAGVGFGMEGAAKPILIGTGIVMSLSGILFGMDVNETTDQLRTRVTPLPAHRLPPAESASTPSPR